MASIQHYVPQFLLKNFCAGPRSQLWAYDKWTDRSFFTNIENVAGERGYYEVRIGDETFSLEPALSGLESEAAALFDRLVTERSLACLSDTDREIVATFVAVQFLRGPQLRQGFIALDEGLQRVLGERWGMPMEGYPEMTEERAKVMALDTVAEPSQFVPHFLNKRWVLMEAETDAPLYIADNPVTLQNEERRSPLVGNLGLGVKGIQIYLPIASDLVLAFLCRSHETRIRNGVDRMRTLMVRDPDTKLDFGPLLDWMRTFRKGTPMRADSGNVLNQNSLQVLHAERFVFCSREDFGLVKEMIETHPDTRRGYRAQVS